MSKDELGQIILDNDVCFYRVAKSILYSDADCGDAISGMIVKSFSQIHKLRKEQYVKTWLIRILINECYQILRANKRLISLEGYQESHKELPKEEETSAYIDLYEAMMRLGEKERVSIELYYMEGYSVKEVAEILGSTETAIRNRLARAREKLKMDLKEGYRYGY